MMIQTAAIQGTIPSQGHTPRRMLTRLLALLASLSLMILGLAFTSPAVSADDIGLDTSSSETVLPDSSSGEDSAGLGAGADTQGHGQSNEVGGTPPEGGDSASPPTDTPPTDTAPADPPPVVSPPTGEGSAVLVCIATTDPAAPYTSANVMPTAIINGMGAVKGTGPANSPAGVAPAAVWGNIVPPVRHPNGASFAGHNWGTDGQAIWNAGCGGGAPSEPPPEEGEHALVSVCMASGSASAPYALEQFSATAIINGKGVAHKEGPANDPVVGVFPASPWGNIVPPVTHKSGAEFAGLNWNADGQRIWNAGCVYVVNAQPALAPAPAPAPAATDFCPGS